MYAIRSYYVLLANLAVVWRLEALSGQGVEGTVLGTIFMPYCSGMGRITSYNVCYTKLLRFFQQRAKAPLSGAPFSLFRPAAAKLAATQGEGGVVEPRREQVAP